jgi:site-specific recombinase XerD
MSKAHLKLVTPAIVNRTVMPRRPPNAELRTREHLTEAEVERLMDGARKDRWGHRDATMVLVAYRHGFRPAELVDLRWDQIDFASGALHVRRVKRGTPALIRSSEMSCEPYGAFSASSNQSHPSCSRRSVERPFSTAGFARMIERAGAEARLGFKAHPHMLRHACGYALANKGHDTRALQAYLGHRNIQHTVRYTELSPMRFRDFWRG